MLDDGCRLEVLAAIGIDVYRLRAPRPALAVGSSAALADTVDSAALAELALRLAVACDARLRRDARAASQLDQVVRALGVDAGAVAWVDAAASGALAALPQVDAWLMVGAAAARAISAQLPLDRQNSATIAVSAEPADWMRDAAARRALWQSLKPLARRLSDAGPDNRG